jgi:hypothetical protein
MRIEQARKYVEHQRNIGYLTGFVRHLDKLKNETWYQRQLPQNFYGFLLQQTNNVEQAIPIALPEGVPLPADRSPLTVAAHVFGYKDGAAGTQTVRVKSLDFARPSIRAMPPSLVWQLDSNSKFADDDFNPFGKGGSLSPEVADQVTDEQETSDAENAISEMLAATNGRLDSRLGKNANVVMVSGFLSSFTKYMPDEHRTNSFWELHIKQHAEDEKAIPVRVYTRDMKGLGSKLKVGLPLSFTGEVRVKVTPASSEGGQPTGQVYLRTDDVYAANRLTDILRVPAWYVEMMRAHREARAAQHKRMVEIAAAQPAASDDGLEMASSPTGAQEASKGNELLSQMFGESHST